MTDHSIVMGLVSAAPTARNAVDRVASADASGSDASLPHAPQPHVSRRFATTAIGTVRAAVVTLRVSDAAAIALTAGGVGLHVATAHGQPVAASLGYSLVTMAIAVPAWLGMLSLARAYEPRYLLAGSAEIHRVGIAGAAVGLVVTAAGWALLEKGDAGYVLGGLVGGILLTVSGRWVVRMRMQRANRQGAVGTRVLVVGGEEDSQTLVQRLERNRYHGWAVVDTCSPWGAVSTGHDATASSVQHITAAATRARASLVLLTPSAGASLGVVSTLQRSLNEQGRDLALAPPLVEAIGPRVSVDAVCGLPIVRLGSPELGGPRRLLKTIADRVAAAVAIVVLSPLMLVIALAVRLTSRGPAVFRQRRVGRDGRLFTIWKFRTMHLNADERLAQVSALNEGAGPLFKLKQDPRITAVGRFLRATSLDELAQLYNVLVGDMSIVGPRPALAREVAQYDEVTRRRLLVQPGITGLWQIHGRSDLSWEETKRLDVRYVENWSLGFDLSIIMRTIDVVLRRKGAY